MENQSPFSFLKRVILWLFKRFKKQKLIDHTENNPSNIVKYSNLSVITGNSNTLNKNSNTQINSDAHSIQQMANRDIINNISTPYCELCAKGLFSSALSIKRHREFCKYYLKM